MRNIRRSFLASLLLVIAASLAYGLGADHTGPVGIAHADKWPEGLKELADHRLRVHGFCVNSEDVFFFSGDTTKLNAFLTDYAKLRKTTLEIVLHPGKKNARSPWDKKPRNISVDWALYASPHPVGSAGRLRTARPGPFVTRIDVWLGGQIELDGLRVPSKVAVKSGGEIEQFISQHEKKRKSAKGAE